MRIFILTALFITSIVSAQQHAIPTNFTVSKDHPVSETNQSCSFEYVIKADISSFTYKLDKAVSKYTEITDDTGFDLLAAQKTYEEKFKSQGYYFQELKMEYRSPISGNDGFKVYSMLGVAPPKGAKTLTVKGVIGMINITEKETTYNLKDVPTTYQYGRPGHPTDMGEIRITEYGSIGIDDQNYTRYRLESDSPVMSITIGGGDDREELSGSNIGIGGNEIIFKEIPEKLNLVVVARGTEVVEIPFELILSAGL